jgi:hypothetical protein
VKDLQIVFSSINSHLKYFWESYRSVGRALSRRFANPDLGRALCGKVTDLHIIRATHSFVLNNRWDKFMGVTY